MGGLEKITNYLVVEMGAGTFSTSSIAPPNLQHNTMAKIRENDCSAMDLKIKVEKEENTGLPKKSAVIR